MSTTPTRVGLIFGGASGEHAVSIRSAATVASALAAGSNGSRYGVSCFYIDPQGRWWGPEVADAVNRVPGVRGEAFVEWLLAEEGAGAAAEACGAWGRKWGAAAAGAGAGAGAGADGRLGVDGGGYGEF